MSVNVRENPADVSVLLARCSRCQRVDPGDAGVQRPLLRPEHAGVQSDQGGQRRPLLLRGQLLRPGGHQDGGVQRRQRQRSL